jgi:antitoxin component of RelBE/YafQ-DinJ toxin-antitoxin module
MTEKVTFRISEDLKGDLEKVYDSLTTDGLDLDMSKVIRYLIAQGLEKLRYDGKLK